MIIAMLKYAVDHSFKVLITQLIPKDCLSVFLANVLSFVFAIHEMQLCDIIYWMSFQA